MKKLIMSMLVGVFIASSASAQWWKCGLDEEEVAEEQITQNHRSMRQRSHREGRPRMTEDQREKIREQREAILALAEAARNETDPAKKAERIDALRVKLTEGAERMQAEFRRRLEKAEKSVEKMKARLANAEKNKEQKVEEHLQKLLAGEKPCSVPGQSKKHGKQGASRRAPPPAL